MRNEKNVDMMALGKRSIQYIDLLVIIHKLLQTHLDTGLAADFDYFDHSISSH